MAKVAYIDVDDTLVRSAGSKRIPIPATIALVRTLKAEGWELYCWSSGGADYARQSAAECGIADCFAAFLPKPELMIDDVPPHEWRYLTIVHPSGL
jgi:hypothetical protein